MSEKRNEYIDQLLGDLQSLEERLLSVKESDALPFSFFSASFDRIEKISRSLHELELMQIGEMKAQMERLVRFLSETDARSNAAREPLLSPTVGGAPAADAEDRSGQPASPVQEQPELPEHVVSPELAANGADALFRVPEENRVADRIVLPGYRDPRITESQSPLTDSGWSHSDNDRQADSNWQAEDNRHIGDDRQTENDRQAPPVSRSLNDTIQAPPALLDLKRKISLNDRFLFQRELFHNNRPEMDLVVEKLNRLATFTEAQDYLRRELNWNFKDPAVKDFLLIVKKRFE